MSSPAGQSSREPPDRPGRLAAAILVLAALASGPASAEKTDRILIANGNEIVGEVKSLERGELWVSTDYMRYVQIDWGQIVRVESVLEFEVQAIDGERYFGQLAPTDEDRVLVISSQGASTRLPFDQVLVINQSKSTRQGKIDASVSFGFNFTQATDTTQASFDGSYRRRTHRFSRRYQLVALLSDTADQSFSRGDLSFNLLRHLPGKWNWDGTFSIQTNEQLGLDRRAIATGSAQHRTLRTAIRELWLGVGIAGSQERFTGEEPSDTSLELSLSLRYYAFHFDDPELRVDVSLVVLPSITTSGRLRSELRTDARRELVSDLFWGLSVYGSFDNEPTGEDTKREDIAVVASLGWKY